MTCSLEKLNGLLLLLLLFLFVLFFFAFLFFLSILRILLPFSIFFLSPSTYPYYLPPSLHFPSYSRSSHFSFSFFTFSSHSSISSLHSCFSFFSYFVFSSSLVDFHSEQTLGRSE